MRITAAGVVVTLVVAAAILWRDSFQGIDRKTCDILTHMAGPGIPSGRITIIELDEKSLGDYGRWPWPRDVVASLVRKLNGQGASLVALDMMFPEPDHSPPGLPATPAASPAIHNNDQLLAASMTGGRVVVGAFFSPNWDDSSPGGCHLNPLGLSIADTDRGRGQPFWQASAIICSLPEITRAAVGNGFINSVPDVDGTVRRTPLLIEHHGNVYPSLALSMLLALQGKSRIVLTTSSQGAEQLRVNDLRIPVDRHSNLYLRFRGGKLTFPRISATDVLHDRTPAADIQGRVAIVGSSAYGLESGVATPTSPLFPGVEVQATAIDNLLQGDPFSRPGWTLAIEFALVLVTGLSMALLLPRVRPLWGITAAAAAGLILWLGTATVASRTGVLISPLFASFALGGNLLILTVLNFAVERRRVERTNRQLNSAKEFMLCALASLTELRDDETGNHINRIQLYMKLLCETVAGHPKFSDYLTPDRIELLTQLAPIHDIGKVGVPDSILRKPGRLTPEEYDIIRLHVDYGRDVLEKARVKVDLQDNTLFELACEIVYSHHEKWDGTGYPNGLKGDEIPIPGRLLALADVYDAIASKRVYKDGVSHPEVVEMIVAGRGKHFDPDIVDAFLRIQEPWQKVAEQHRATSAKSA